MIPAVISVCSLLLFFCVPLFMGHFGSLSPYPLGLLSGVGVVALLLSGAFLTGRYSKKFFVSYIAFCTLVLPAVVIANWWHYQYFQAFFNYQIFTLGGDLASGVNASSGLMYKSSAYILVSLTVFFSALTLFSYRQNFYQRRFILTASVALLAFSLSSLYVAHRSYKNYHQLGIFQLTPSFFHPAHAFFYSGDFSSSLEDEHSSYEFYQLLNRTVDDEYLPRLDAVDDNYNILLIVLESVRSDMLGYYGNSRGLSPNLDRLAKELIVVDPFYASANYTMKSEFAIWCGMYDLVSSAPLSRMAENIDDLDCLPNILKKSGYFTAYYHGNDGRFNNRRNFLPKIGFDYLYFHKDRYAEYDPYPHIGWGLDDVYMYQVVLDEVQGRWLESSQPQFASVTTLNSHYPFTWDWGIDTPNPVFPRVTNDSEMYSNYENAVYHQDYALGEFWRAFEQSSLYKNTVVVITNDHGVWTFGEKGDSMSLLEKNERFFRAPLLIYHPLVKENVVIDNLSSHVDLPPTILDILDVQSESDFLGKSLLNGVHAPWSIMMKHGDVVVRVEDTICYVSNEQCAGIHQNCVSTQFSSIRFDPGVRRVCVNISGDILTDNSLVMPLERNEVDYIEKAFDVIRRDNRKVLDKK